MSNTNNERVKNLDKTYDLTNKTLIELLSIMKDAYLHNYNWWIDMLHCDVSFRRMKVNMDLNTISKIIDDTTMFSFIHRKSIFKDKECFEFGFRHSIDKVEYFLWILLSPEEGLKLIDKYDIKSF